MQYAPIVIFCYKRVDALKMCIASLKSNFLAEKSVVYIYSDAPKSEKDNKDVAEVRTFIDALEGFKEIHVIKRESNWGLAKSIISGVTEVIEKYEKVIVLEDDLVTSANFLNFMNEALNFYASNKQVFSISGYTNYIKNGLTADNYFTLRSSSWGWATWKDRWINVDWDVNDFDAFLKDKRAQRAFNAMGSDLSRMLKRQMAGQINSWAIRWCYSQFKQKSFTVYPSLSKIQNIGFGKDATHNKGKFNSADTLLDTSNVSGFNFLPVAALNKKIVKQFTSYFSVKTRAKNKLLNLFFK